MFLMGPKVLKGRVPIGTKSSYSAQKFLLGVFLSGPKVPIGRVPIGLTDEFIGLKNSSQSAQFWFLLGAFLLGSPPVSVTCKQKGRNDSYGKSHLSYV